MGATGQRTGDCTGQPNCLGCKREQLDLQKLSETTKSATPAVHQQQVWVWSGQQALPEQHAAAASSSLHCSLDPSSCRSGAFMVCTAVHIKLRSILLQFC